jgi:hypothetical protein
MATGIRPQDDATEILSQPLDYFGETHTRGNNHLLPPGRIQTHEADEDKVDSPERRNREQGERLNSVHDADDSFVSQEGSFVSGSDNQASPLSVQLRKLQIEQETNSPHKPSPLSKIPGALFDDEDVDFDESLDDSKLQKSLESTPSRLHSRGTELRDETGDVFSSSSPTTSTSMRRPLPQVPGGNLPPSHVFPTSRAETPEVELEPPEAGEAGDPSPSRPRVKSMYESPSKPLEREERPASMGGPLTRSESDYSLPDIDVSDPLLFDGLGLQRGDSVKRTGSIRRTDSVQRESRQRITREAIQERVKARSNNSESGSDGTLSTSSSLASLEVAQVVEVESRVIHARPPVRTTATTLSESGVPSGKAPESKDGMDYRHIKSPLDKLASSVQNDETVKEKGVTRRRSLSTGDADVSVTLVRILSSSIVDNFS